MPRISPQQASDAIAAQLKAAGSPVTADKLAKTLEELTESLDRAGMAGPNDAGTAFENRRRASGSLAATAMLLPFIVRDISASAARKISGKGNSSDVTAEELAELHDAFKKAEGLPLLAVSCLAARYLERHGLEPESQEVGLIDEDAAKLLRKISGPFYDAPQATRDLVAHFINTLEFESNPKRAQLLEGEYTVAERVAQSGEFDETGMEYRRQQPLSWGGLPLSSKRKGE